MTAGAVMFGRTREMLVIEQMQDRVAVHGGALLIRGEAGVGKSFLVSAAGALARRRGFDVLTTTGVQSEAHLPFAGLHQLLRPVLAKVDELPGPQRDALLGAFGMSDAAAPEFFFIALAALDLLADRAARSPLLLVAEDVQWLDRPTCDVLAFAARRLESEPTILLATIRTGYDSVLGVPELPELLVEGLDEAAAGALLDARAPDLSAAVRARVLAEAAGNPLALVELPVAMGSGQGGDAMPLPPVLPLTRRLERAFAARMGELPDATRHLLLVAAVDDSDSLDEVLRAGALFGNAAVTDEALVPAVAAGLVDLDDTSLRFRHPLVRSAIRQAAAGPERRAAHAALARVLAGQPDRATWHRAASLIIPDEAVATELEQAASRARHRGAIVVAVTSLERAAQLTAEPARRGNRLLRAAELAFELGRQDMVMRLLHEAQRLDLDPSDTGRRIWLQEVFDDGDPGDTARVFALVEAADRAALDGDTGLALNLLRAVALRCFWDNAGSDAAQRVVAACHRIGVPDDDPQLIGVLALAAPIARGAAIAGRLSRIAPDATDPDAARLFGSAAFVIGDCVSAAGYLAAALDGLRAQGQLALLAQALVLRAWTALHLGSWSTAMAATEEGGRLAGETAQPLWMVAAQVGGAMLAGLRGEQDRAAALADDAERLIRPRPVRALTGILRLARGQAALSDGRYEDAYQHLNTMFDPTDRAHHPVIRCWAVADLAEAAVRSGHRDTARTTIEAMQPIVDVTPSPMLHAGMLYARVVLADDDHAETLFQTGLATGLSDWRFLHARLQLAYGAWLRRRRRANDARTPLRGARETLDALGAVQWAQRARDELRAAGEISRQPTTELWSRLSPQELQIAQMAADGMSNREIGQRLYLSHRTVGSHLYRIFPKLAITSRSQLRAALDGKTLA